MGRAPGKRRPDEPEVDAFGAHFDALLRRRRIKPAEAARRTKVAPPILSRLIAGERKVDLNTLIRLARGLEVSLDELLGFDGDNADERSHTRAVRR